MLAEEGRLEAGVGTLEGKARGPALTHPTCAGDWKTALATGVETVEGGSWNRFISGSMIV